MPVPPEIAGREGVEVPRPVGSLDPKSSGKWMFLLQKQTDDNGNSYFKSYAIKDESLDLKEGYLIINLSDSLFVVQMNNELHEVRAGGRYHFKPKPLEDGTVDLRIVEKKGTDWDLVVANTVLMPEKGLTTMFLTKNGHRVWIRRFVDQQQPAADER